MVIHFILIVLIGTQLASSNVQFLFPWERSTQLESIKKSGVLKVLTHPGLSAYDGSANYFSLEHELITRFADHIGVKAHFFVPSTYEDIFEQTMKGTIDIAAAGIMIPENRKAHLRYSPTYDMISEQIVYRSGKHKPKKIADLSKGVIEVAKGSGHEDILSKLKMSTPELEWYANPKLDTNSLIYLVNEGLIDYTVASSNQIAILSRFFPHLRTAFALTEPQELGWILARTEDSSLYDEIKLFFNKIKLNGTLEQIHERQYGHLDKLDYISLCKYYQHIQERLPLYRKYFEQAALEYNIDWRLLAAIGYQESHWNKKAKSPTGVRGIMMLTQATAREIGIEDRTDPVQSILGGALYFNKTIRKLPTQIQEPDRTWMALAAYNIGYGHLQESRALARQSGDNPNKWSDVKKHLPNLRDDKWRNKTRHGYVKANKPIRYVENIRNYYELLAWSTEKNWIQNNALKDKPKQKEIMLSKNANTLFYTPH